MKRIKAGPIGWHVFSRGARRLDLFRDPADRFRFLVFLKFALDTSGAALWGFVLMTNHYHLILFGDSEQVRACLQRLNRLYSRYHNEKYGLSGHAFDGPYQAYPQYSRWLLLRKLAYVFLNPVDAGLGVRPEDYPWSCYRDFAGLQGSPFRVDSNRVMDGIGPDRRTAWSDFHHALKLEAARSRKPVSDKLSRTQVHADQFAWLLDRASSAVPAADEVSPLEVAMWWGHRCGVTARAMLPSVPGGTIAQVRSKFYRVLKQFRGNPGLAERFPLP